MKIRLTKQYPFVKLCINVYLSLNKGKEVVGVRVLPLFFDVRLYSYHVGFIITETLLENVVNVIVLVCVNVCVSVFTHDCGVWGVGSGEQGHRGWPPGRRVCPRERAVGV